MTRQGWATWLRRLRTAPVRTVVVAIELYRNMVSPLRLPSCRFHPTCSEYALDAMKQFGLVRGSWLAVARLAKCGPWHPGGWDPVPAGIRPSNDDGDHGTFRGPLVEQGKSGSIV